MCRRVVLPLVLTVLLTACAATTRTIGIREPKLTSLNVGDTRAQVEGRLGKRLWRPGSADGLTYDIYQYQAALPAAPWWGVFGFAMDFFTLGLSELTFREGMKSLPLKQVAVAYDEMDRMRFVSQPWGVPTGLVGPCAATRSLLPGNSGVPATASPTIEQAAVGSRLVTLDFGSTHVRDISLIDGVKPKERFVELPPGQHTVKFNGRLGGSVLLSAARLTSYGDSLEVQLLRGRVYRLKHQRVRSLEARADVFWIEDVHSGETLQCASP
jgi:hypothetical protein